MENLKENQIVWAQFEGYPWWPSVIKKIENGAKICVLFLGTDEKGIVPINKIREWSDENFPEYVKNIKINKIKEMSVDERKETFQLLLGIAMTLQIQEGNFEYKTFEEFKKSHQEKEYIQIAIKFVNFVQSQGKKDGHNEEFDICLLDEYFPEDENEQSLINHHQNKCRKFKGEIDVFHKFIEEHPLCKNNKNAMIKNKKELKEFSEEISTYIQNGFENRLINLLRSLGLDLPSYDVNTIREQMAQIKIILNKEDITKYRKTIYEELHWFFRKICNELFNKIEIETKENEKLISYCTIDFDSFIEKIKDKTNPVMTKNAQEDFKNGKNVKQLKKFMIFYKKYLRTCFPFVEKKFIDAFTLKIIFVCINYSIETKLGKKLEILITELQNYIKENKLTLIKKVYELYEPKIEESKC